MPPILVCILGGFDISNVLEFLSFSKGASFDVPVQRSDVSLEEQSQVPETKHNLISTVADGPCNMEPHSAQRRTSVLFYVALPKQRR